MSDHNKLNIYINSKNRRTDETPSNFISNGYIDCELEIPAQTTTAVDFLTNNKEFIY